MNIKIIAIFLAAFLLPLNSFAFENSESTAVAYSQQQSVALMDTALYLQNQQTKSYQRMTDSDPSLTGASVDRQGELFMEICVYIIIIMVYSLYWLLAPNESNHHR